ncbi:MAG: hypothetical protein NWE95_07000 [Candidatus Bathyarchaeota archaeon]|nr:hypothetical protein [Candidatus Bathyarchaeota archaeon]
MSNTNEKNTCHPQTSLYVEAKAYGMEAATYYCDGSKHALGSSWTFSKHVFRVTIALQFTDPNTKTINWELKNVTDNIVIDSGNFQHTGADYTSFDKIIETTQNHTNDTIRLTTSTTQNASITTNLNITSQFT